MSDKRIATKRQLRSFGLIVGAGFAAIALSPLVLHGRNLRNWALVLSMFLAAMSLLAPAGLRPLYRVWMMIGEILGWVNTRIILSIVYYGLIVPIGAILHFTGNDPMHLKFDPESKTYRICRTKRPAIHMRRQY